MGAYRFVAELWAWDGNSAWHFVSVPPDDADDIEARFGHNAGGFGSIKVEATIGTFTWQTSLFPDSKRATYILPVKKAARQANDLRAGSPADVALRVLVEA